jgi:uncharacterized protein (UPF0548 family)
MLKREYLDESSGIRAMGLPNGFVLDRLRTPIGIGKEGFERAIQTFRSWDQFNLGWVRVANPSTPILLGQIVAVEVHSLGLWSLNLSQIVEVVQTEHRFGFIYKTTTTHVEAGEERFEVTFDEESGVVSYLTEAVSRPRDLMALLGYPITRWFQHHFARDSHARMQTAVSDGK